MKQCCICMIDKEETEFVSMVEYGCTCKDTYFCTSCILGWLKTSSTNGNVSLRDWCCPHCRGRKERGISVVVIPHQEQDETAVFIELPPPRTPSDWQTVMFAMHARWRESYPGYPAQTTLSETLMVEESQVMHVDVTVHDHAYFFVYVMDPQTSSFLRTRKVIEEGQDMLGTIMTVINQRYRRYRLMLDLLRRCLPLHVNREEFIKQLNVLEASMIFHEATDLINRAGNFFEDSHQVEQCFIHFLLQPDRAQGRAAISAFVDYYHARRFFVNQEQEVVPAGPYYYTEDDLID